jgi:iron complex outermembrane recepter protein
VSLQPAFARTIQGTINDNPREDFHSDFNITYQVASADAKVDGSLAALPAGDLKFAGGAAFRRESLREVLAYNGVPMSDPTFHLDRNIDSVYAELFAPVIGSANTLRFAKRLELSAALRYDRYQGIGSTVNPKYGVLWSPYDALLVRATYGTAFRAPALQTRAQTPFYYVIPLNDPAAPGGTTNTLFEGYVTNKSVKPENSTSFTIGLELRPAALPISSSVSYFHTEYRGRITMTPIPNGGDFAQIFPNERLLGPYLVRNPDPALVAAAFADPNFLGDYSSGVHGPAGVGALFYYGDTNVASSVNSGIDASASYRFQLGAGDAQISVFATYLIENTFVPIKNGPQLEVLNDVGEPVGLRVGSNFTWSRAWFSGNLAVRHVDSYKNSVSVPPSGISAWTTMDLQLALDLGKMTAAAALRGVNASLAIRNLADKKPPFAQSPTGTGYLYQSVNYDPANADALGRVVSVQFKKSWGAR